MAAVGEAARAVAARWAAAVRARGEILPAVMERAVADCSTNKGAIRLVVAGRETAEGASPQQCRRPQQ